MDGDEICDDIDDCVGVYDECGVCNGNGTSCPDTPQNLIAIGGLNQITLNWSPVLTQYDQNPSLNREYCDPISNWCFSQSTQQSFYLSDNVLINGQPVEQGSVSSASQPQNCPDLDCDVIGAFCNENLVSWTYPVYDPFGNITIPVMLDDGSDLTQDYCNSINGDIPNFVLFDNSSGQFTNLEYNLDLPPVSVNEFFNLDGTLSSTVEISYNIYRDGLLYAEGIQETMFIDQDLGDNEYHCYQVTQFVGDQESGFSNESCATTDMPGCTNIEACNYNPEATIDDGSCLEEDCLGECGGDAVIDDCGVCDGNNDDLDCFGECGGDAELDDCGVCDGDGLSCNATIIVDSPLTGYISYNGKVTIVINDEQSEINLDDSVEVFIDNFSVKKILYQDISEDNSFDVYIKYLWDHFISLESVNLKLVVLDPAGEPYTNNEAIIEIENIQVSPPSNFVINGIQDTLSVFTYYINNAIYNSYSLTEDDWIGFFCNNEENGLNIIGTQKWGYINPEEYLEILEIEIDENWCQSEDGLCTWSRLRLYQDIIDNGLCDIGDTLSIQMYIAEDDMYFPSLTQNTHLLGENNVYINNIWANVEDCNGVSGGTAFYDECGICSGGDTGIIPNDTLDCNGDCDGLALIDECGICCDGNTFTECSYYNNEGDIPIVTGVMDCNNNCPGDSDYGSEFPDCQGDCFGDAYLDECGICDYDSNNNNETCSGCTDPDANNTDEDATLDDGSCTYDVEVAINEFFYRATINVDIPDYVEIINVTEETKDLSNWTIETGSGEHNLNQFNIELLPQSLILITGSGNFYDSLGNEINLDRRYIIPGFSLSSYEDFIILRNSENNIVDEVMYSDEIWPVGNSNRGHALELNNFYYDNNDVEYWSSADESVMSSYMYNEDGELENHGTPLENNSNYIGNQVGCDGVLFSDAEFDDCGVCSGNNFYNNIGDSSSGWNCGENFENCDEVDCEGDCIEGTPNWDLGEDILPDCNGICFGDAEFDDCGECGGDNSTCSDCAGIPNGDTLEDECGQCGGDNYDCEDPESSCLCAGCMDNTPGLAPDIYGCCADQVWNPNEGICLGGTSVNEEGYCLENNGYYFTNYDPLILIDNGSCSTWNPEIISIIDIPEDQGYHVYLTFSKAHFDDESLPRETAGYSIERLDNIEGMQTWVNVASGFAYGQLEYTYEVETLVNFIDSVSNGNTTFRVIASMDEGLYLSDEFSGFSIDNIIPSSPTGINISIIDNNINLNWNQNQDIDLDYYNIYHKEVDEDEWNYDGSTNQTNYSLDYDSDSVTEIYITAVDINDNESENSQIVSTLGLTVNINLPTSFEIFGSYPNPFNPITNISYSIPSSDLVEVSVYNINGILEQKIYDGIQQLGVHNIKWDATLYASGIYFIKIHYKNKVKTQKVILLK